MIDFFSFDSASFMNGLIHLLIAIAVLYVARIIINHFMGRLVERLVMGHNYKTKREEKLREKTLISMIRMVTGVVMWTIIAIIVLQAFGVNLGALAAGAGLLGVVVGFGAQNMIKDFLSGLFIIVENQYRIGDVIEVGEYSGLVEHITMRMTTLRGMDGSVYFIPNGQIPSVRNMTLDYSGLVVDVAVSYDTDITKAEQAINEVGKQLAEDEQWQAKTIEPITFLRVDSFGESGVNLKAAGKTTPLDQWDVAGEYRKRLKTAFEKHGIEIALPQRVIHQHKSSK